MVHSENYFSGSVSEVVELVFGSEFHYGSRLKYEDSETPVLFPPSSPWLSAPPSRLPRSAAAAAGP